ncbi:hypothetical protein LXA43DRAFT_571413 [Ganoderma leucocontextum]|nr:hypothetical protein LXA43DRAFT_571413 [Ganoderma leucocontextum]
MPKIASSRSACVRSPLDAMDMGARRSRPVFQRRRRAHGWKTGTYPFASHPSKRGPQGGLVNASHFSLVALRLRASRAPTPTAVCTVVAKRVVIDTDLQQAQYPGDREVVRLSRRDGFGLDRRVPKRGAGNALVKFRRNIREEPTVLGLEARTGRAALACSIPSAFPVQEEWEPSLVTWEGPLWTRMECTMDNGMTAGRPMPWFTPTTVPARNWEKPPPPPLFPRMCSHRPYLSQNRSQLAPESAPSPSPLSVRFSATGASAVAGYGI